MSFHAVADREPGDCGRSGAGGNSPGPAKISLFVTVESHAALDARKAVFQCNAGPVELMKIVPVPRSSKVRLLICAKPDALEKICIAVMRAVPAGEFSRVSRA